MTEMITYHNKIKKISFFDIWVSDIHAGEDYSIIDTTNKLTYHEVWEWISRGGDWSFKVTEHENPENIFLIGSSYKDMDNARKGEESLVLGHATEKEMDEIHDFLRKKREEDFEKISQNKI